VPRECVAELMLATPLHPAAAVAVEAARAILSAAHPAIKKSKPRRPTAFAWHRVQQAGYTNEYAHPIASDGFPS
jgi:hypothetical protein